MKVKKILYRTLLILAALLLMLVIAWDSLTESSGQLVSKPATPEEIGLKPYYGSPAIVPSKDKYPDLSIPVNQFLDPNRSGIHEDTYNSDVTSNHGATGRNPSVVTTKFAPFMVPCPTVLFDEQNRFFAACISPTWVRLYLLDPHTMDILATEELPRKRISLDGNNNASGGGYVHKDAQGNFIVGPSDNTIRRYKIVDKNGEPSFKLVESTDLNPLLQAAGIDTSGPLDITDTVIDYDGRMWFTSAFGLVGYINEKTNPASIEWYDFGVDMQNQTAIDPTGMYVVTVETMNKLVVDPDGKIRLAWSKEYDVSAGRTGLVSTGSGTSPTLFGEGDDLLAITDNAAEQLHLNIYRREDGSLLCAYPVFKPGLGGAENSPSAYGDEIVIPNNYGFPGYLFAKGSPFDVEEGLMKIGLKRDAENQPIDNSCYTIWEKYEYKATAVPFFSTATGLIYTHSVHAGKNGEEAWYLNLIDWETGESVNRTWVGNGPEFDNITAQIAITPDGGAVITARNGLILVRDN